MIIDHFMKNLPQTTAAARWEQYETTVVRDIAWILLSPRLVSSPLASAQPITIAPEQQVIDWLNWLDTQPALYFDSISPYRFRRLGLYVEALLHFVFRDKHATSLFDLSLLGHNIQIADHTQTLGEIDMLLACNKAKSPRSIHLEVAAKFYLLPKQHDASDQQSQWIGGNIKDRLDLKLSRLSRHQLTLLDRNEAQDLLDHHQLTRHDIDSAHLVIGRLYQHAHQPIFKRLPPIINPHCLTGRWLYYDEFLDYLNRDDTSWYQLEKVQWLTSGFTKTEFKREAHNHPSTAALFTNARKENDRRPYHFAYQTNDSEIEYMMVVPPAWPNR